MAMFEELSSIDIIEPAVKYMQEHGFVLCEDGKIRSVAPWHYHLNSPWINTVPCPQRLCTKWTEVYWGVYGIISRNCMNCWKIVAKPKTLRDLFKVFKLQEKMGYPGKVGIERRPHTLHRGPYGAYWYCPLDKGLEFAKERWKEINLQVKEAIGIDTKVILKRGCSEMEDQAGPSNEWEYPEYLHRIEDLLDVTWECPDFAQPEPTALRINIMRRWIDHARKHRDPTAKDYYDSLASFGISEKVVYHDKDLKPEVMPRLGLIGRVADAERCGERFDEEQEAAIIQRLPDN